MIDIIKTKHFQVKPGRLTEKCPYRKVVMIGSLYCMNICEHNMGNGQGGQYINVKCNGKKNL